MSKLSALGVSGMLPTYAAKVKALFGANLIAHWKLDEESGTTAADYSGNGRTGTYSGVVLKNSALPVRVGRFAPYWDGVNDYCNIYSASLAGAFNGQLGSLIVWWRIGDAAAWTDDTYRWAIKLQVDANNYIVFGKGTAGAPDYLYLVYRSGGVSKGNSGVTSFLGGSEWQCMVITWDLANDECKTYMNGQQFDATGTGLGTWAGALAAANTVIGANDSSGSSGQWKGNLAHVSILDKAMTLEEVHKVARYGLGLRFVTVLGDSISVTTGTWAPLLDAETYYEVVSRAVGGAKIETSTNSLAVQATAAANDAADIIIIHMGTNDDNAGDMGALQTIVEDTIIALKASNPTATIYYMNVLPRWITPSGAVEVDKANIRAAVAAACTAQSVTCWDTYTVRWIEPADTADGLHPSAGGYAKILAQVLARMP